MKFTINENGMTQIANFLKNNHKDGARLHDDFGALCAWASDAEFQLAEGNPPSIEIHASRSSTGHTQEFTISDEGVDCEND